MLEFEPTPRPSFKLLPRNLRDEVVKGFHEVSKGGLIVRLSDSRVELRENIAILLDEVINHNNFLDEDDINSACWAIGRDLATAYFFRWN